jgi:flagellar biosynthesis/type III secretory pathway protein FliH
MAVTKVIKAEQQSCGEAFALHYFPNIPCDFEHHGIAGDAGSEGFQCIEFEDACGTALANPAASATPTQATPRREKRAPHENVVDGRAPSTGSQTDIQGAVERLDAMAMQLAQAAQELVRCKQGLQQQMEMEAIKLASLVARRIVGYEASINKDVVLNVVREALGKVNHHEQVTIKVNPQDLDSVRSAGTQFVDHFEALENIQVISDSSILPGGCMVETQMGEVDARVDRQAQIIEAALEAAFHTQST